MPKQPSPERQEGRALFLDAIAPLRTAQTLGYRQGLQKAIEIARNYPDHSGTLLASKLEDFLGRLAEHPE